MDDRKFIKSIGRILLVLLTIIVLTHTLNLVASSFNKWLCNIDIKVDGRKGLNGNLCLAARGSSQRR